MIQAKILLDSINPVGDRLTTFELEYPRYVHSELMTHRVLSKNSASSRAIPFAKMKERVLNDPVIPIRWGRNKKGMQAGEDLPLEKQEEAKQIWLEGLNFATNQAQKLNDVGVHKNLVNRMIEPYMYIVVILSGTTFKNWFTLRTAEDAQDDIQALAKLMLKVYTESRPIEKYWGTWHIPMIRDEDKEALSFQDQIKVATARIARVSYLTHDGRKDYAEDIRLHNLLRESKHWSCFEHCAYAYDGPSMSNFKGWYQYRKEFEGESGE